MEANLGLGRTRPARDERESRLICAAQAGDEGACAELVSRYRGFVRCKARGYFLAGADRDDVLQEALIGLYKAIRDYDGGRQASFRSFAELCVTRQIITAVKTAQRHKHSLLNSYVSLNRSTGPEADGERVLGDVLAYPHSSDPAEIVISSWEAEAIRAGFVSALSPFETHVLKLYLDGDSYQEIALRLRRHVKSVDNALQRIKRKIELQMRRAHSC